MKILVITALFCLCSPHCFGGSITVYNDSPFPLNATILAADGTKKANVHVMPQHTGTWNDPSPPNAVFSQTPYTVVFTCKNGKQFGVYSGASQGSWVTAMSAQGERFCEPEKKKEQKQQSKPNQALPPDQQHDLDLGPP